MHTVNEHTDFQRGAILLIDKPRNWTSFDVVRKIRNLLRARFGYDKIKVGHAGTLDPLATGLVLVCTGKATKQIHKLQSLPKEYLAEIHLGQTTPSYDLETEVDENFPVEHITEELFSQVLDQFCGEIAQRPPAFSAKWVDGKRAYDMARSGQAPELEAVTVRIHHIELVSFARPDAVIKITCSKGTYIRSLAHDLGKSLRSGAYLKNLIRTRIGDYRLSDALTLEKLKEKIK